MTAEIDHKLHLSLRRLVRLTLRPIARILIRNGLNYSELLDACKEAYVDAAARELGAEPGKLNVSKAALLTGMTRRDVRRIAKEPVADDDTREVRQNNASRVLSGWHQDAEFRKGGNPRRLPLHGDAVSFQALVHRYASDIPVGSMLSELKRVNAVYEDENGLVVAAARFYMPAANEKAHGDAVERAGSVLRDIGTTIDYNLGNDGGRPSRFEGRAANIRVSKTRIPAFRRHIETHGQRFLESIDAWLTKNEPTEQSDDSENISRLGIGLYWIQDSDSED